LELNEIKQEHFSFLSYTSRTGGHGDW